MPIDLNTSPFPGKLTMVTPATTSEVLHISSTASQSVPVVQCGGPVAIWSPTRNTSGEIEQDPYNNLRINGDLGANVLVIRNKSEDTYAVSGITFWDGSSDNDGNGKERLAIGFANSASGNEPFSGCTFLETSHDPAIGSLTDPPTTFKLIQTGFLNGGYGAKVRFVMDDAGVLTFNDVNGVGQFKVPMLGPGVNVLTQLAVGKSTLPTNTVDVTGATGVGIRIEDTSLTRSTYLTNETDYFQVNSAAQGVKVLAGGTNRVQITNGGDITLRDGSGNAVVTVGASSDTLVNSDTRIAGNVAIGSTASDPSARVHLIGATGLGIRIEDTTLGQSVYLTSDASSAFNINSAGSIHLKAAGGNNVLSVGGNALGFYNATPAAKPTVSGSRGGNAALADLLTELATLGLITDSSTA